MSESTENTEKTENKQEEQQAGTDEYGEFAGDDDFQKDAEFKGNDTLGQNEYGEFAGEGMEGVNETISEDTGEVKKERPPVGFTGSQPLNFLIGSVIAVAIFAIYMDWEKKMKNKKPEGVTEVNKTGWKKADQTAEDWKKSGNKLFKEKDYDGAIVDYTMAIKIAKVAKEQSAVYHVNRANAYFELNKHNECLDDCSTAKVIDANYLKIYWRVAKCMEVMEKQEIAVGVLKDAAVNKKLFDLEDRTNAFTKFYRQLVDDVEQFAIYPANDPTRKMFNVHCHWMHQMGADLDKVELKFLKNQLPTLRVNVDIEDGHPIMIFPQSLVVSLAQMGEEIPAIAHLLKLQAEGESITQYEIAPLWFIHASRTKGHAYEMYSHIIGMTNHLYPGNFSKEEQECGEGSKLNKEIGERKAHIKMCYNRIRAYLFQNNKIDFQFKEEEYTKYWQLSLTRGFTYPIDGEGSPQTWGINVLQNNILRGDPFKANCAMMKNGDKFGVVAMKELKAGDELRFGMPAQQNGHLQYITTGCVEYNWFDRILIKTDITMNLDPKTTPHYDLKKALLLNSANNKELNIFQCMGNQNIGKIVIAWARFITYEGNVQYLIDTNNQACGDEPTDYPLGQTLHKLPGFHGFNMHPRSLREEQKVWAYLEKKAKARMGEYSRINEEVALNTNNLKRNLKNILLIRQQEKANINQLGFVSFHFMTELSKDIPNLDNIDNEIKTRFRYQEYIDSIKDLPLAIDDQDSGSEEEVSDHDEPDRDAAYKKAYKQAFKEAMENNLAAQDEEIVEEQTTDDKIGLTFDSMGAQNDETDIS